MLTARFTPMLGELTGYRMGRHAKLGRYALLANSPGGGRYTLPPSRSPNSKSRRGAHSKAVVLQAESQLEPVGQADRDGPNPIDERTLGV